jgi:hypothetical protein
VSPANAWGVLSQLYRLRLRPLSLALKRNLKLKQYTDHRRELRRDLLSERPAISLLSQQRVSHLPSGFPFRTLTSCTDSPGCSRNISGIRACRVRRSLPSPVRRVYRRVSSWYKCAEEIPQDASRRLTLREPSSESVPQENTPVSPVSDIRCVYRLRSNPLGHVEDKVDSLRCAQ